MKRSNAVFRTLPPLRKALLEGRQAGVIVQRDDFMEILDPRVRDELETLRGACISELNEVLRQAQIATV